MQRNHRTSKSNYFNSFLQSAKLAPAIIIVYCSIFGGACRAGAIKQTAPVENVSERTANALNINTASAAELEKLPAVGREFARRIVEHRERFGEFRRPEHLLLVRGMSDKKFRNLKNLVTTR